jgi:hypothetical protein
MPTATSPGPESDVPFLAPEGADPALVAALRDDLRAAGYTVDGVREALGTELLDAIDAGEPTPARTACAAADPATRPAAALLGLLALGVDRPGADVDLLLPRLGADGARRLGVLAEVPGAPGDLLAATVDLRPHSATDASGQGDWWFVSDRSELATGRPLAPHHVLGVGGASETLVDITPRPRVATALDLGTGCGVQAAHLARHADTVVATDLSERALAMARFGAQLNGTDVELLAGSFLEPVAGRTFDLIVSNPPFVVSPRGAEGPAYVYRDAGGTGDAALGALLAHLGDHLAPGGHAALLGNWEIEEGQDWDAHPRSWLEGSGLDAWVLQRDVETPLEYARTWLRDGGARPTDPDWAGRLAAWTEDLASRGTAGIGFGYVLLHRPAGPARAPWHRFEEQRGTVARPLGPHLLRAFERHDLLARLTDVEVGALRPVVAPDVIEHRFHTPGAADPRLVQLTQGAALARTVTVPAEIAGLVGACDGDLSVDQIAAALATLLTVDAEDLTASARGWVRDLVVDGLLDLPGQGAEPLGAAVAGGD